MLGASRMHRVTVLAVSGIQGGHIARGIQCVEGLQCSGGIYGFEGIIIIGVYIGCRGSNSAGGEVWAVEDVEGSQCWGYLGCIGGYSARAIKGVEGSQCYVYLEGTE